jgi:hypothetical protein
MYKINDHLIVEEDMAKYWELGTKEVESVVAEKTGGKPK